MKRVVVGTDFSPLSQNAVNTASSLLAVERAELYLVHVVERRRFARQTSALFPKDEIESTVKHATDAAKQRLCDLYPITSNPAVTAKVLQGVPAEELVDLADSLHASLLILSSHGYGAFRRVFLGRTAARVISQSKTPVVVVGERRKLRWPAQETLVAIDLSDASPHILQEGLAATAPGGRLTVMTAFEGPVVVEPHELLPRHLYPDEIDDRAQKLKNAIHETIQQCSPNLRGRCTIDIVTKMGTHSPAENILEEEKRVQPDLTVVGRTGLSRLAHLGTGGNALQVIVHGNAPVLVVPLQNSLRNQI